MVRSKPDRRPGPHDERAEGGVSGPVRYCPACYAMNGWGRTRCASCGAALASGDDYDARLVWALDHPDGETAVRAAIVLGVRRAAAAIDALGRASRRTDDPYRAAAAVRALRSFGAEPRALAFVDDARSHPSVIVRREAVRAVDEGTFAPRRHPA